MSSKLTDVTVTTSSAGLTGLDALRFQLAYRPAIAFLDDVLVVPPFTSLNAAAINRRKCSNTGKGIYNGRQMHN